VILSVSRVDQRRQDNEEDDVGSVLELASEILQIPLHRFKGKASLNFCTSSSALDFETLSKFDFKTSNYGN